MAPESMLLQGDELCVHYRSADGVVPAVVDVTLRLRAGAFVVLAGPSGSGKSSLLRVLGLIDRPTSGALMIDGRDVLALGDGGRRRLRRARLAYVHQRPVTNLVDDLTAAEQVAFALQSRRLPVAGVHDVLTRFGLAEQASSRPAHLSGGEQQRLAIAMATAVAPSVLLADEPTAELDRHHADGVIAAIAESAAGGQAVVVASHDPEMIAAAHEVVWLHEGRRVA
ncbi:MAG: ATP-binding cassette domain-containing protein [Actinomycetota bacterium]|nr:ATP-binding cassette domain-containing protein [Actinomycetota bacterium]